MHFLGVLSCPKPKTKTEIRVTVVVDKFVLCFDLNVSGKKSEQDCPKKNQIKSKSSLDSSSLVILVFQSVDHT